MSVLNLPDPYLQPPPAVATAATAEGALPRPLPTPSRPAARPQAQAENELVPVYVWDLLVRWTHWLIVLSIVVLSVTGFLIGDPMIVAPGRAVDNYVMATVRAVHSYSAVVFTLAVLSRLLWMFIGPHVARWHQFVPVAKDRRRGFLGTIKFYLFMRRTPPPFIGHNPVAGAAYTLVFGLYLVMIATGLAMYSTAAAWDSPGRWFSFLVPLLGGANMARWIHHVVMWLLLGFAVHHVYSGGLVAIVERNGTMDSIVSGWKWFKRADVADQLEEIKRG
jgi:Ni/Fe-hydrogenase 1 B-type cytochrome subunit